ncbi:hypothetical protein, partial [Aeromonas rivipollensis]|uniref:hypothetical protein n=1 Tax=Aeromonas rivipollensis TaxID=948519 RepID=UPI001969D76B
MPYLGGSIAFLYYLIMFFYFCDLLNKEHLPGHPTQALIGDSRATSSVGEHTLQNQNFIIALVICGVFQDS